jgi:hypothetical protein
MLHTLSIPNNPEIHEITHLPEIQIRGTQIGARQI